MSAPPVSTPGTVLDELRRAFPDLDLIEQPTLDQVPTAWVPRERIVEVLRHLKERAPAPYRVLYDLTAIDERERNHRAGQPRSDFTLVYRLLSFERNTDVRLKVALQGEHPSAPTATVVWPMANWYEREVWDMFGVRFEDHPNLRRILLPPWWEGHALRKDHVARATELGPFALPDEKQDYYQDELHFRPEDWGMARREDGDEEFMFLNLGPQHPGTHGVLRVILQLSGETVVNAIPDIGYHHRGAEKMGERQTWHTYIPYTDRVDYLSGYVNELAYLLSVERLAGIELPPRAQVIRIMLTELYRIGSHLVWYGTYAQDVGSMSPVFYTFEERERVYDIVAAFSGARMHPAWFRIGGTQHDLPRGWDGMIRDFIKVMRRRIDEYVRVVDNSLFRARTRGVGAVSLDEAIEWGMTGPGLRACGFEWDCRKARPYAGYENFEFEIPIGRAGDCYDRGVVRIEEMRQSLRIMEQCLNNMPEGPYKALHPLTTPPIKDATMQDIETLITHFLGVSWGPVIPAGEAEILTEGAKGLYSYNLVSDGSNLSYRTRIRAPSFPHMQMLPLMCRGAAIPDVLAILGAMDYVLADVDR